MHSRPTEAASRLGAAGTNLAGGPTTPFQAVPTTGDFRTFAEEQNMRAATEINNWSEPTTSGCRAGRDNGSWGSHHSQRSQPLRVRRHVEPTVCGQDHDKLSSERWSTETMLSPTTLAESHIMVRDAATERPASELDNGTLAASHPNTNNPETKPPIRRIVLSPQAAVSKAREPARRTSRWEELLATAAPIVATTCTE